MAGAVQFRDWQPGVQLHTEFRPRSQPGSVADAGLSAPRSRHRYRKNETSLTKFNRAVIAQSHKHLGVRGNTRDGQGKHFGVSIRFLHGEANFDAAVADREIEPPWSGIGWQRQDVETRSRTHLPRPEPMLHRDMRPKRIDTGGNLR